MKNFLLIGCLCMAVAATAIPAAAQQDAGEIRIGPIAVPEEIQGVTVTSSILLYLKARTDASGLYLDAHLVADLADLQAKIGAIIDTIPLPTNNCASFKPDNLVARIPDKQLLPSPPRALLEVGGAVDVWQCLENPVPNSKVEWVNDGPFGVARPKIVTWPGDPIKNKGATQPFDATLPVTAIVVDPRTVALRYEQPEVRLGGQYAFLTNGILNLAGVDLNAEARKALDRAIDPKKLQTAIPAEYARLNPTIRDASFGEVDGHLALLLDFSAAVSPSDLTALINSLLHR
jgi:hypothetical protein